MVTTTLIFLSFTVALYDFFRDIRPTFLFWARGGPVALLRGANRPLLTRLIQQEVDYEAGHRPRAYIDIDFDSDKVIQCGGDLALLENDDTVRSIGNGNTDRLSTFFNDNELAAVTVPKTEDGPPESQQPQSEADGSKAEDGVSEVTEENTDAVSTNDDIVMGKQKNMYICKFQF